MKTKTLKILFFFICLSSLSSSEVHRITVIKELDDDHVLIKVENGPLLFLEKWNVRLSPLLFEGKSFIAEISPMWVTIYFENREPIKWSIEANYDNCTIYESTNISGTISGSISIGDVFKTSSGNIYEVIDSGYSYVYEYHPEVLILKQDAFYILFIEEVDRPVTCRKLDEPSINTKGEKSPKIIRAFITSDFKGLNSGNIYVLSNGQIWEQIEPYIWIWIWIHPPVIIWEKDGIYYMKVDIEGIPKAVAVKRIK